MRETHNPFDIAFSYKGYKMRHIIVMACFMPKKIVDGYNTQLWVLITIIQRDVIAVLAEYED